MVCNPLVCRGFSDMVLRVLKEYPKINQLFYDLCIVNLNIHIVQGKKQISSKPKFTEVVIGENLDILEIPLDNNYTESLICDMVKGYEV